MLENTLENTNISTASDPEWSESTSVHHPSLACKEACWGRKARFALRKSSLPASLLTLTHLNVGSQHIHSQVCTFRCEMDHG